MKNSLFNFLKKPNLKRLIAVFIIVSIVSFVVTDFVFPFWRKKIVLNDIMTEKAITEVEGKTVNSDTVNIKLIEQKIKSQYRNFLSVIFDVVNKNTLYNMYFVNKEIPIAGNYEKILENPKLTLFFNGGYPDKYFYSLEKNNDGSYDVPYGSKRYFVFSPEDKFDIGMKKCVSVLYDKKNVISFKPYDIYIRQNALDFWGKFIIIFIFLFVFVASIFSVYYSVHKDV